MGCCLCHNCKNINTNTHKQIHKYNYANTSTQKPLRKHKYTILLGVDALWVVAKRHFPLCASYLFKSQICRQHFCLKLQMIERLSQINFKLKLGKKGLLRGGIGDLVEDVKQWGWNWAFSCLRWYLAIYSWRHNSNCNWLISCYVCSVKRVVTGIFHVCGYFLIIL